MSKNQTLNIFEALDAASAKNYEYYSSLSEAEQKALSPLVLMRWMSGTGDAVQILCLNQFMNPYVFRLHNEKELLWKLACACSSGKPQRYKWMGKKGEDKMSNTIKLIRRHYRYTEKQARDALRLLSEDYILDLAHRYAYDNDTISKIKKELKDV